MKPQRAARTQFRRAWLAASLLALGAGCGSSSNDTVMVVSVSSDLTIGSEIDTVKIVVADGELSYPFTLGAGAGKFQLPVRVALVPGGRTDRQFRVQALGMLGGENGDNIVTQSASVSFVSGTAQQLSLFLARSCVRFPMCDPNYTCQNGACVPETTAGTRGSYTGDAGASPVDSGQDHRGESGTGAGGAIGSGGMIGTGGMNGSGGTPGTGGGGGTVGIGGMIGSGGTGAGGIIGIGGTGGTGTGGVGGIGGTGAGTGSGGTGTGGVGGTGAGAGTGSGGTGTGGVGGIGGTGAGAGTGSGGTGIGGMTGIDAGSGMGGFTSTGLGGAGGTFSGGGGKLGGLGGGIINPGLGGSAASPSGLILFRDDFETGFADAWLPADPAYWQVVAGSGADATSVYQHDGAFAPGNVSIAGDPSWDDVVVESKINVSAFAASSASYLGGICARVSVPGDYYLLALRGDGRVDLRRVSGYVETVLTATSAPVIAAGTWSTVRLSAVGTTLNAYLNGSLILTADDATYPSGEIGLQTDGATAQFDDVVVTRP